MNWILFISMLQITHRNWAAPVEVATTDLSDALSTVADVLNTTEMAVAITNSPQVVDSSLNTILEEQTQLAETTRSTPAGTSFLIKVTEDDVPNSDDIMFTTTLPNPTGHSTNQEDLVPETTYFSQAAEIQASKSYSTETPTLFRSHSEKNEEDSKLSTATEKNMEILETTTIVPTDNDAKLVFNEATQRTPTLKQAVNSFIEDILEICDKLGILPEKPVSTTNPTTTDSLKEEITTNADLTTENSMANHLKQSRTDYTTDYTAERELKKQKEDINMEDATTTNIPTTTQELNMDNTTFIMSSLEQNEIEKSGKQNYDTTLPTHHNEDEDYTTLKLAHENSTITSTLKQPFDSFLNQLSSIEQSIEKRVNKVINNSSQEQFAEMQNKVNESTTLQIPADKQAIDYFIEDIIDLGEKLGLARPITTNQMLQAVNEHTTADLNSEITTTINTVPLTRSEAVTGLIANKLSQSTRYEQTTLVSDEKEEYGKSEMEITTTTTGIEHLRENQTSYTSLTADNATMELHSPALNKTQTENKAQVETPVKKIIAREHNIENEIVTKAIETSYEARELLSSKPNKITAEYDRQIQKSMDKNSSEEENNEQLDKESYTITVMETTTNAYHKEEQEMEVLATTSSSFESIEVHQYKMAIQEDKTEIISEKGMTKNEMETTENPFALKTEEDKLKALTATQLPELASQWNSTNKSFEPEREIEGTENLFAIQTEEEAEQRKAAAVTQQPKLDSKHINYQAEQINITHLENPTTTKEMESTKENTFAPDTEEYENEIVTATHQSKLVNQFESTPTYYQTEPIKVINSEEAKAVNEKNLVLQAEEDQSKAVTVTQRAEFNSNFELAQTYSKTEPTKMNNSEKVITVQQKESSKRNFALRTHEDQRINEAVTQQPENISDISSTQLSSQTDSIKETGELDETTKKNYIIEDKTIELNGEMYEATATTNESRENSPATTITNEVDQETATVTLARLSLKDKAKNPMEILSAKETTQKKSLGYTTSTESLVFTMAPTTNAAFIDTTSKTRTLEEEPQTEVNTSEDTIYNPLMKQASHNVHTLQDVNDSAQPNTTTTEKEEQQTSKTEIETSTENLAAEELYRSGVIRLDFVDKFADNYAEHVNSSISSSEKEKELLQGQESSFNFEESTKPNIANLTTALPFEELLKPLPDEDEKGDKENLSITQKTMKEPLVTASTANILGRGFENTEEMETAHTTESVAEITTLTHLIRVPLQKDVNSFSLNATAQSAAVVEIQKITTQEPDAKETQQTPLAVTTTTESTRKKEETTSTQSLTETLLNEMVTLIEVTETTTETTQLLLEEKTQAHTQTDVVNKQQQQIESTTENAAQIESTDASESAATTAMQNATPTKQQTTETEINSTTELEEYETTVMPKEPEARALSLPPPKLEYTQSDEGVEVFYGYSSVKHN